VAAVASVADATVPNWWPHRAASEWVQAGAMRWHVQRFGPPDAPVALLLHGTGAGTHSWRHLAPLLARTHHVIVPDLPGHAFTQTPATQELSLPAVAAALAELLTVLSLRPTLVIGHSAGAAIALRMVLDRQLQPTLVAAINGAIVPLQGPLGRWFMPMARLLAANTLVAPAFAAWATLPTVTRRLLDSTGSRIDALGERCYSYLVRDASHAGGALRLMASWDLAPLAAALPTLTTPLLLLSGGNDKTLPPEHAQQVARWVPRARCVTLPELGHLAHEEDAAAVAAHLHDALRAGPQLPAPPSAQRQTDRPLRRRLEA
jgi:magnesium chelatase accessory protein